MQTTTTFDLPIGYTDPDTMEVHKTVTLRMSLLSDFKAVHGNERVIRLATSGHKINVGEVSQNTDGTPKVMMGETNPVAAEAVESAMHEVRSCLFARIVIRLGTIDNPIVGVFMGFNKPDWDSLVSHYEEFMNPPAMVAKDLKENNTDGEEKKVPLEQ